MNGKRPWPPSWFGLGSTEENDLSERVDELLDGRAHVGVAEPGGQPTKGVVDDAELAVWLAAVGGRIRKARQQRGTSRELLAQESGVTVEVLRIAEEKTAYDLDVDQLWRIADALRVPLADLIMASGDSPLDRDL